MGRWVLLGLGILLAALLAPAFQAQEALKPGRLSKEELAALQPGLTLRFSTSPNLSQAADTRRARLPALHVPTGAPATSLLAAGPVQARFTGYLKAPAKGDYAFRLTGTGTAVLTIGAKALNWESGAKAEGLGSVELARGYNKLELDYHGPERSAATLRLDWKGETFPWEPVPPELFFSRGDDAELLTGQRLREGRVLYATLGCAQCHALPGQRKLADCSLPELEQRAPSLTEAGSRLQASWLARWLADPRSLRPTAMMPKVLHGEPAAVQQQAADLAAYLQTLDEKPLEASPSSAELSAEGQKLFARLGCLGCHHVKEPGQEDTFGRLALSYVGVKFKPGALAAFLRRPHEHYPWSRMPDFRLDAKEATALAAFLNQQAKGTVTLPGGTAGDAGRGAKLFGAAGCASCHSTKANTALPAAHLPAATAAGKGCLAEQPAARGKAPEFGLTEPQRQALRDFLATDGAALTRESAVEFAARQVRALQCQTCHHRDGVTSKLWEVLAEEGDGTLPENVPPLSWTGQKLRTPWTVRLLAGEHDHRARPWLKLRMPTFPARAELLATGLSHEHGYPTADEAPSAPDAKLAAIGEKLIENVGGFNCISCHGVGKRPPVAPFEAPGINLLDAAQRLRPEYYARWMIDPTRVEVTTKMPKFAQDGQTTPIKDVLDGDARRQYEAIWHFMLTHGAQRGK